MAQEASDQQPSKVSFEDYEWEQDEEWQVLVKKLEFPGTFDDAKKEKHILKRKVKYFKEKIDPNFKPPPKPEEPKPTQSEQPQPTTSSASSSSSSDSTSSSSKPTEQEPPKPSTSSTSSSSSSSSNSGYSGYQRPSSGYGAYQPPPTKLGQLLSPFLNYYYLISQWFVFVCCLLSLISPQFYYRALYGTILMYLINLIQTNGKPQWNMYYAQRVMQDENVMIAIYAAIFLMGNPVFVFLSPIIMRSFYMGVFLLNGALGAKLPSLYHKCRPYFQKVLTKQGWFVQRIAILEVSVGIFLIFACFFMSKTVILTFIYWQIMHARYMMSNSIKHAFTTIHIKIQSILSKVPFLLNAYLKLAGYLWNMVDPQRIQQQMQNQQAAGGGLSKYCAIM